MPKSIRRNKVVLVKRVLSAFSAAVLLSVLSNTTFAQAMLLGDEAAGEKHAQEKCASCHTARFGGDGNEMYTRDDRRVKTVEGLMQQVQFCNANTGAGFDEAQQDDIIAYLNGAFYHYGDE